MSPGETTQIEQLREALDGLSAALTRRNAWRRVLAVLAAVAIGVLLASSLANRQTLGVVRDVTDPQGEFAERAARGQRVLLAQLLDDGDCRHHRATAGLPPPPDAFRPCRDQTPSEVYDGPSLVPPSAPPSASERSGR